MKRLSMLLVTTFASISLTGCFITSRDGHSHGHSRHASRGHSCHPSQYWDGHQCRHKGKGHGARKHDGRKK